MNMKNKTTNPILEAALHYADIGFSVIPVGQNKKSCIEWKRYQKEHATREQITEWFTIQFPDANVGVVTGAISGIVVVDVKAGGNVKGLSPTVTSRTGGGGWHLFYKHPQKTVRNGVRVRELTDIRGDGGYAVMPPSLHASGGKYEWQVSPDDVEFEELPQWVINTTSSKRFKKTDWQTFMGQAVSEGERNMTLTQFIGKILHHLPDKEWDVLGLEMVKSFNLTHNTPPLEETEVLTSWESIRQRETKKREEMSKVQLLPAVRVKEVETPARQVSFERWHATIEQNFPELAFPAEVCLATVAQILITDITNPCAVVLVDVPASGKTITLNFFGDIEELTYATDNFTPASFVSNAANVKKEKLSEIDLLPRIQYKTLLVRDFATMFSKRDDDLANLMGILTRVLDGEGLNTDSGVHGRRYYVGEYLFMMLGASTPIPPKVWKLMGTLGSRLLFITMNSRNKTEDELAAQLVTQTAKQKELACRVITKEFLYTLWSKYPEGVTWDRSKDPKEYLLIISRCATLLAHLRGIINVWVQDDWGGEKCHFNPPTIEKPDRLNQVFYNMARGHALTHNRTQIGKEDLLPIVELALDSAPTIRSKLFRKLIEYDGVMSTSNVMEALNCSRPTASKEMETLRILGICHITEDSHGNVGQPEKELHLTSQFDWFLSDECMGIRRAQSFTVENDKRINKGNLTL